MALCLWNIKCVYFHSTRSECLYFDETTGDNGEIALCHVHWPSISQTFLFVGTVKKLNNFCGILATGIYSY